MSFFDQHAPSPEPPMQERPRRRATPEWIGPPTGVLPGVTGERLVLIQTNDVVMTASHFDVYPTGIRFVISLLLKDPAEPHHGAPWERRSMAGATNGDRFLRLGMVYADGRSWSNTNAHEHAFNPASEPPSGPHLFPGGGGGGDGEWHMRSWMWPLPPPGDVTFYTAWPAYEILESSVTLNTDRLMEAGGRAETIWSEDAP